MHLHTEYPFWLIKNGLSNSYPSLTKNIKTGVVIIGAGITGALAAYYLTNAGYDVVVVDKRHAAMGSTAASTALLQYEIDLPLRELIVKRGLEDAVKSYRLCAGAIEKLTAIAHTLKVNSFTTRPSLQFASYASHIKPLQHEYLLRKQYGFPVTWLEADGIKEKFSLEAGGGIFSACGAETDPYELTHKLLAHAVGKGAEVFDMTEIKDIRHQPRSVLLTTTGGYTLGARYAVMATGYESYKYLPKRVDNLCSTYAIVSKPAAQQKFWYKKALIWETTDPYNYLRTTHDNRIIIGGKDDDFSSQKKRTQATFKKADELLAVFQKLMPQIPFVLDFAWAGVFSSTRDGLPYIGKIPERDNTFFSLGYGGNGIVFSVIAAETITDMIRGKKNEAASLFAFNRV